KAASYASIEALLQRLESKYDWQGVYEGGHLIGLVGPDSSVTLEPGGQMELSGRLCPDIHCCQGDFSTYIAQLLEETASLDLALLGMGSQPFSRLEEIEWVPKSRYDVMGPYMLRTGDMGQRMMKQTA
ncbi:MAG: gamma-glutamylcysteine synthetase, partial [Desulfuromonadales bacterium]|nr:gamma-glutamylcysteine synthetase [Desulfuromonadales bacterium]NIS42414.1 gamma-glutamylcysteine synthetase [Desulfuromonadales bacterium]